MNRKQEICAEMTEGRINTERRHRKRWRLKQRLDCEGKPSAAFDRDCLISTYVSAFICVRKGGGEEDGEKVEDTAAAHC